MAIGSLLAGSEETTICVGMKSKLCPPLPQVILSVMRHIGLVLCSQRECFNSSAVQRIISGAVCLQGAPAWSGTHWCCWTKEPQCLGRGGSWEWWLAAHQEQSWSHGPWLRAQLQGWEQNRSYGQRASGLKGGGAGQDQSRIWVKGPGTEPVLQLGGRGKAGSEQEFGWWLPPNQPISWLEGPGTEQELSQGSESKASAIAGSPASTGSGAQWPGPAAVRGAPGER